MIRALAVVWWTLLVVLVIHLIVWPDLLARPATTIGESNAAFNLRLHWSALLVIAVLVAIPRSRARLRST